MNTITLPNGYNGDTIKCFIKPILEEDKTMVKLQCAEPGTEYMFRWVYKDQYKKLVKEVY